MEEEFERIVREYQDKIFRLALSMLGDRAAAEEAAQEALVRVWKGLTASGRNRRFPPGSTASRGTSA